MRLKRESEILRFTFSGPESQLLLSVFRRLAVSYRLKPEDLDPRTAAVWYSDHGCASAKMSKEETQDWLTTLQGMKAARLPLLQSWTQQLSEAGPAGRLQLTLETAPAFMGAINDHRLHTAARYQIGQEEMDIQSPFELMKLSPERQTAMLEIHFLAWILEETLRAVQTP